MGHLVPAVQLRTLIVCRDEAVFLAQTAVLLVNLLQRQVLLRIHILLQLVVETAGNQRAAQVQHQVVLYCQSGILVFEDILIEVGEQQLQALGMNLGDVQGLTSIVPAGLLPIEVVVVTELMDSSGKIVKITIGRVEVEGSAVSVQHGGKAGFSLGIAKIGIVEPMAAHIGERFGHFAGELPDIGLDHIQRDVPGVILRIDRIAGIIVVERIESIVQRNDVLLYRLMEGTDFLLGVVPLIDLRIGVIGIVVVIIACGDFLTQGYHTQIDVA